MATHRKRHRYTPHQRQDYIEQFERSGLKQAEFCRRAKVHPMTFSLWRRKLTKSVFAEVQVSAPVAVAASDRPAPRGGAVLHLLNGAKLEVALDGASAWAGLGLMLKTLQA